VLKRCARRCSQPELSAARIESSPAQASAVMVFVNSAKAAVFVSKYLREQVCAIARVCANVYVCQLNRRGSTRGKYRRLGFEVRCP
jgi:hypothetical protein